jgi:two-component system, sporulation sensor kinase A
MQILHPFNNLIDNAKNIKRTAHILYMYNDLDRYVENAVDYIYQGLIKGAIVLFVENEQIVNRVKEQLQTYGLQDVYLENLICVDKDEFYLKGEELDVVKAGNKLNKLLEPLLDNGYSIHTWGGVPLPNHESTFERVRAYECDCDVFVAKENIISVCAYNALTTPACLQNELLKTHSHFMTDDLLNLSPLYNHENQELFPVIEIQKLHRILYQKKNLEHINSRLLFENNLVKVKNDVIKQSEQKLRNIINVLPIPIIIRRNSDILFFNDEAQEQLLTNNQEDALKSFFMEIDNHLLNSSNEKLQEFQFIVNNETPRYYLVDSIDLLFEEVNATLHSFVDITQKKENEKLIIQSEKINIAGELAASIAHELRNPLTAIKGFFHLLRTLNEDKEMYYNIIESELSRIEQISSELLTLAKPNTDNRSSRNIIQIIDEVKMLLTSTSNMKSIVINLETCEDELFIYCEVTKIKQVFINLIKNAIDAMNNAGTITIKVMRVEENVQVQIIDQGCGIPKVLLDKIGEPFYTTKEKGTGIGLMVCYQIIESHKGTIHVKSQFDVGTTFTITLPITIEE